MKTLSVAWNQAAGQYIAKYKEFGTGRWKTKRVPKGIAARGEEFQAVRWLEDWYQSHLQTGGVGPRRDQIVSTGDPLKVIAPKWLELRENDQGTAVNTHAAFKRIVENWILDNPRFQHDSIESLDMAKDFSPGVCLAWIKSMNLTAVTKVRYVDCLKSMFRDCIVQGWLPEDQLNPLDHVRVVAEMKKLRQLAESERRTSVLSDEQVDALLLVRTSKVADYRRVRYVTALGTGLRDMELQGLTWGDLALDEQIPYLWVWRQLIKGGRGPFTSERDLLAQGLGKKDIKAYEGAVTKDPKRRSKRAIPLHPLAVAVLLAWKTRGWSAYTARNPLRNDPVFPSSCRDGHQKPGQFCICDSAELLRRDLERLNVPTTSENPETQKLDSLDFHALRRTFATRLAGNGVPSDEVGELLGHGAVDTASKHYIRRAVEARYQTVLKLPLPERVELWSGTVQSV